jgi:hypothetical protein
MGSVAALVHEVVVTVGIVAAESVDLRLFQTLFPVG